MPSIPSSTKASVTLTLVQRARERWPQITTLNVRYRGTFAYIDAELTDGQTHKLCRLRYTGYSSTWRFAIYRYSHQDYQDSWLPNGTPSGTPEQALDTACGLYLGDITAWTEQTPTNFRT